MEQFTSWLPTITTAAVVVGVAFVADSSIKRHEGVISDHEKRLRDLETTVAVLEAKQKG